jgi:UPF0755 protein
MAPVRQRRSRWTWLVWGLVVILILSLGGFLALYRELNKPFQGFSSRETILVIPRGQSVSAIAAELEQQGIVQSSLLFRLYLRWFAQPLPLKAGEYRFVGRASIADVASKLQEGRVLQHRVTVPEGLDLPETAAAFSEAGFADKQVFLQAAQKPDLVRDLDPLAVNLEGYLFPDTYFVTREMSESDLIQAMVQRFRQSWDSTRIERARVLNLTLREVVTLASLIEKEAALSAERPLISAVFHNRLARQMKLACDPTVIYAAKLGKIWDGVIHQSDLAYDSPYNTYLYPGLPPGPIANPGDSALEASLFPTESDYLFFVSRNDGSHEFSTNYRDHSRAVQRYQR